VTTFPIKKRINTELFIREMGQQLKLKKGARKIRAKVKVAKCLRQRIDKVGYEKR